ncbi:hypothetical protein KHA96_10335 [Bacillus sp. FJAT-49711]|uniref:hypothetical protein n=1 Tax=Bacillus sp. FJAT-49711 TaxID=2833585 RepID=UPI001BC8D300|nr:hypothetical protein [Bacillus sp. FJAT-49711]MBS4218709.1 hypothetical protein [Bacillus sp. FJAT-49711]
MKKVLITSTICALSIGLVFSGNVKDHKVNASAINEGANINFIKNEENLMEYTIISESESLYYIETTNQLDDGTTVIHTEVFDFANNIKGELIEDFYTSVENNRVTEQSVLLDLRETNEDDKDISIPNIPRSDKFNVGIYAVTSSNRSLVSVMNINYTRNYSTGKATANWVTSRTKTGIPLSNKAFNDYAQSVDSMRNIEVSTGVGAVIAGVAGSIGAKKLTMALFKNLLGPIAIVTYGVALGQWLYQYDRQSNLFLKIPPVTPPGTKT